LSWHHQVEALSLCNAKYYTLLIWGGGLESNEDWKVWSCFRDQTLDLFPKQRDINNMHEEPLLALEGNRACIFCCIKDEQEVHQQWSSPLPVHPHQCGQPLHWWRSMRSGHCSEMRQRNAVDKQTLRMQRRAKGESRSKEHAFWFLRKVRSP